MHGAIAQAIDQLGLGENRIAGKALEARFVQQRGDVVLIGQPQIGIVAEGPLDRDFYRLAGVRWGDVDLCGAMLRVERSLEETKAGLRFKVPKTKHGRRTISLPQTTVEILRDAPAAAARAARGAGQGKPGSDALVFATVEAGPLSPDNLSRDWRRTVAARGLPRVMFHALRHSHASALIASGLDVLTISRRLGHGSPVVTLTTYAHLFGKTDTAAANAIEVALITGVER